MNRERDDSDEEFSSDGSSLASSELSISTATSQSSFDARDALRDLEADLENELAPSLEERHRRPPVGGDADLRRLMDMPHRDILWGHKGSKTKAQPRNPLVAAGAVTKKRQLHSKPVKPDHRFGTDVFTAKQALREARRNMTPEDYARLVNFVLRRVRIIGAADRDVQDAPQDYWHVDDPNFRQSTGVGTINRYARQLLDELGFVCVSGIYWVWPEKHLHLDGDAGLWGHSLVPANCPGRVEQRLGDVIKLLEGSRKRKDIGQRRGA